MPKRVIEKKMGLHRIWNTSLVKHGSSMEILFNQEYLSTGKADQASWLGLRSIVQLVSHCENSPAPMMSATWERVVKGKVR